MSTAPASTLSAAEVPAAAEAGANKGRPGGGRGMTRLPIVQMLLAADGAPDDLGGDIVTMTLRNPDGFAAVSVIEQLVAHIAEQITFADSRIGDGDDVGGRVWRIALEDIVRENRALLNKLADDAAIDVAAWVSGDGGSAF